MLSRLFPFPVYALIITLALGVMVPLKASTNCPATADPLHLK